MCLLVLVGVWAGSAAVGAAQRGMAGSPCFLSAPGASGLAGWGSGSCSPCGRGLLTKNILKVLACCCCPFCSPRQLPKFWQRLARGRNKSVSSSKERTVSGMLITSTILQIPYFCGFIP